MVVYIDGKNLSGCRDSSRPHFSQDFGWKKEIDGICFFFLLNTSISDIKNHRSCGLKRTVDYNYVLSNLCRLTFEHMQFPGIYFLYFLREN